MKTALIALSVATLFASATVSAADNGTRTRADVIAEYKAAVAAGQAPIHGEQYAGTNHDFVSTKTREQVRAETLAARERGDIIHGEQYPQLASERVDQGKTRAQVREELAAYRVAHPDAHYEYSL